MAGTRDVEAGRAFVRVYLNDSTLVKGLRNAGNHMRSFGASISGMGVKMTAMGGAMALPFVASIKAASDMEETMNKFNVVFGSSATAVKAWSDDFAGSVGRSKQQAADFMASMQDLFVPLGFSADSAQALSKQVTALAVDLASFNNMADADTIRDLQAALTGSGEVMKKYGVIVSEAAVKLQLLKEGIDPKRATEQQKVQARLNIIMAGTTAAQGDAIRSAGAWANQMKKLWGVINDTAVVIGSALLPVVTPILTKAGELVTVFGAWAEKNQGLAVTIATVVAGVIAAGVALTMLGGTIAVMGFAVGGLASVMGAIISPLGLLVAGIAGGTAAFLKFTETGQAVADMLRVEFDQLLGTVQSVMASISDAFAANDFKLAASIAWAGVVVAWEVAKQALMGSWNSLANGWDEFWTGMVSIVDGVVTTIRSVWASAVGWIAESLMKVWGLIEKALSAVGLLNETTDIGGAVRAIAEETARKKAGLGEAKDARDAERGAALSARKAVRGAAASSGVAAAQEELARLVAEASVKAQAAEQEKANAATADPVTKPTAAGGFGSGSAAASFSSAALASLGQGGGPMDKLVKINEDQKKIAAESRDELRKMAMAFVIGS